MNAGGEFDLIARIAARVHARHDVVLGIGDDGALLRPPAGHDLVIVTDTLNAGVHFPLQTAPVDIGWKALAVNLSDLAAMGAQPAWCTLALSLPEKDAAWLDSFLDGFLELADQHGVALVGGDTTRGPLSATVTACGFVAPGAALRRSGAGAGDDVWVSGTLGDAALALRELQAGRHCDSGLRQRLDRPRPRVALGAALVGVAHAAIDVSDGVLQDLGHICRASRLAAEVAMESFPGSSELQGVLPDMERWALQSFGDDYELCFTAPAAAREAIAAISAGTGIPMARIGRMREGEGVIALANGRPLAIRSGFDHFA